MRYLLDTNIISDLLRNPAGKVAQQVKRVGESKVCTSIIVAAELRYGVVKKGSPQLAASVEAILTALEVLALETPADKAYGQASKSPGDRSELMTCSLPPRQWRWATP